MMPSKIKILPDSLMKRIAAGEVVERPASVAKELLENSLDAGATSLSLLIKNSGMSLIQVGDNGEGMTEEDALVCCEKHATSKITSAEDLDTIRTLGFRGEALASIGSVSRMTITTSTGEGEGTQVVLEGGRIREVLKVAAKRGTTVAVKDLFANVPARRKFLKSPGTELRHMVSVFRRMALSFHENDFSLFIEDEKTLDLRKSSKEDRIKELFSEKNISNLVPVQASMSSISVNGFIRRPGEGHRRREESFFFLNHRYIVNKSLMHGVLSAYGPRLGRDEYPLYILFLEMDPRQFDVNVHPTKIEVRFADERFVHDALKRIVQQALQKPAVVPEFRLISGRKRRDVFFPQRQPTPEDYGQLTLDAQQPFEQGTMRAPSAAREVPTLFQIHNRYILSQIKSGLTIIDQHVAHERILYEKALQSMHKNSGMSQQLLFPQTVQLSTDDFLVFTEMVPFLKKIGFELKDFGRNTVVIEAVPVDVKTGRERELLLDMIEQFKEDRQDVDDTFNAVAKAYACKSAVKSGERLTLEEMASLIDHLFTTQDPYFCPHGRPILVNLTLEEIDKRFGR